MYTNLDYNRIRETKLYNVNSYFFLIEFNFRTIRNEGKTVIPEIVSGQEHEA